ncbi:DUF397 domain-containing protein [Streptomyces sp. NPDC054783]
MHLAPNEGAVVSQPQKKPPPRRHAPACLEVAVSARTVHIRGSKNSPAASPTLHLTPATWVAFTASPK